MKTIITVAIIPMTRLLLFFCLFWPLAGNAQQQIVRRSAGIPEPVVAATGTFTNQVTGGTVTATTNVVAPTITLSGDSGGVILHWQDDTPMRSSNLGTGKMRLQAHELIFQDTGGSYAVGFDLVGGALTLGNTVATAAPSGGSSAAYKLGAAVTNSVALDTAHYLLLEVGGKTWKVLVGN